MYTGAALLADWILNYLTNTPKHTHKHAHTRYYKHDLAMTWPDTAYKSKYSVIIAGMHLQEKQDLPHCTAR